MKPPSFSRAQVARWMKRQVLAQHRRNLSEVWETGGKEQAERLCRETAEKLNQINNLFKTLQLP